MFIALRLVGISGTAVMMLRGGLFSDSVAGEIAVQLVTRIRFKVPGPPDHTTIDTYNQAKVAALVIFNGDIGIHRRNSFSLFAGKRARRE